MKLPNNPVVLYHRQCLDGSAAAAAVRMAVGDGTYLPVQYNEPVPEGLGGKNIIIVDFSYPREVMQGIHASCESLVVLDHHETAERNLAGLPYAHFDMERSGAGLAWDYFHPGIPRPKIIDLVEDGDLFRFRLADTQPFAMKALTDHYDLEHWTSMLALAPEDLERYIRSGDALYLPFRARMDALKEKAYPIRLLGHDGFAVEAGREDRMVANDLAAINNTFGAAWHVKDGQLVVSMRSVKGFRVLEMAEKLGGGGHAQAASFVLPATPENMTLVAPVASRSPKP